MSPWQVTLLVLAALVAAPLIEAALLRPAVVTATAQACLGSTRFVVVVPEPPPPVQGGVRM